jgi:hypothetical protein
MHTVIDHAWLMGHWPVLETHEHRHLRAERPAVEFDRLFAATVEEQISLNLHGGSVRLWVGVCRETIIPLFGTPSEYYRTLIYLDAN